MRDSGSNRAKLIENAFRTNISKMPDFVCTFSQFLHVLRQAIVRVRQDENAQRLFRFFLACHVAQLCPYPVTCAHVQGTLICGVADVT